MTAAGVLTASIGLQLIAAALALRLIRVTGWRLAWLFVSAALVLMSVQRGITLYGGLVGIQSPSPYLATELATLAISVLMVAGVALVGPLLDRVKRMERDLLRSEERLSQAANLARLGHWVWDEKENRVERYSAEVTRIFGLPEGAEIASFDDFLAYVHSDDRDRVEMAIQRARRDRSGFEIEYRIVCHDGPTRYVVERSEPVLDETGELLRSVSTVQDITERKIASEEVVRNEERLRQATELAGLGHWVWDEVEGKCIYCPEEHARIHGVSVEEYLARSSSFEGDLAFTHPDDRDEYRRINQEATAARKGFETEYKLLTPSGETRYVHELAQPVFDDAGTLIQMYGTIQDITEIKCAEQEIHRLNRILERRVEQRTTELHATRDALLRNEHLAALGQLTGSVAHELRNPLGAIATSFDVIQNKCEAAQLDLDRALGRAERNIKRCDGLIGELLDFTRTKSLQPEPTVVDAWLSEVLEEQHIPERITVNRVFHTDGAIATFDREQIRRAVINVVDNACQAMAISQSGVDIEHGKELTVATRRAGERIEIQLADTGPGIPAQDLRKVLEPLFSTKSGGTGLGLPIVQRIMDRHSGGLEITSDDRQGTRVLLWLPSDQVVEKGLRGCLRASF